MRTLGDIKAYMIFMELGIGSLQGAPTALSYVAVR